MTDEHTRIEELLSAMQDGAATPEDAALVERHLATCARCRATANAFAQVDREVRRYLMATPVPEIAAPWRAEPLLAAPTRPRTSPGHWRITIIGLALVFALLLTGTALTYFTFTRDADREAAQTDTGATGIAAQAALPTPTRDASIAFAAPASAAASTAASARAASGAAASAAPSAAAAAAAPAASSARPSAAASAAASTAGSAAPAAGASAAASAAASASSAPIATTPRSVPTQPPPLAAATPTAKGTGPISDGVPINPVQTYRLDTATALTICRPACDASAQPAELLRQIVAALDRPLPPGPPVPPATVTIPYVTLRFALADGRTIDLGYYAQINELQLPDGKGLVTAPPEFVAVAAGFVAPR